MNATRWIGLIGADHDAHSSASLLLIQDEGRYCLRRLSIQCTLQSAWLQKIEQFAARVRDEADHAVAASKDVDAVRLHENRIPSGKVECSRLGSAADKKKPGFPLDLQAQLDV